MTSLFLSNHKWPLIPLHSDHDFAPLGGEAQLTYQLGDPHCTGLIHVRPKARPRLGTRSHGKPPTPMRQHRPWLQSLKAPPGQQSGPPLSPGTIWCPLIRRVPRSGRDKPALYPPHSPLITSAIRQVPVPSRLMTPKHLKGWVEGTTGQSGNNQLLGGGATTTPPKFKKQSLKGHCPSSRHGDNARQTRASQTRKSKTSQLAPNRAARAWGAEATPSRPGSASPRLGDAGDAGRSVVCGARPSSAKSLHSQSGPAAERHRGNRGSG